MKERIDKKVQVQYTLVQGVYWIFAAASTGFMTPILQGKGFSDVEVGILNADKCISMILFQMLLSTFCDKYARRLPLKYIIVGLGALGLLSTGIFYYAPLSFPGALVLFLALGASVNCIPTLIDSLSIQYMNHGQNVSYTFARGLGSFTWAVSSIFIGQFSNQYGAENIIRLQMVFLVILMGLVLCLAKVDFSKAVTNLKTEEEEAKKENETVHGFWHLLTNYPKYAIFIFGCILGMMSYTMGNTFLINVVQRAGGNDFHFGVCQFVLAIAEVPTAMLFMRMKRRFRLERLMILFSVFNTLQTAGTIFADNVYHVIFCQAFEMFGFGLYYAAKVYFVKENLPDADVVKASSLITVATNGIGTASSMVLCGYIKSVLGLSALLWIGTILGILSVVVMVLLNVLHFQSKLAGGEKNVKRKLCYGTADKKKDFKSEPNTFL